MAITLLIAVLRIYDGGDSTKQVFFRRFKCDVVHYIGDEW